MGIFFKNNKNNFVYAKILRSSVEIFVMSNKQRVS